MSPGPDGLLLLDKPPGPTSHDLVAGVRRVLDGARVGHTGTLDPPASGLLPLLVGASTRLARYLPDSPKRYAGRLQLGVASTTDDAAGEVVFRHDGPMPRPESVLAAAARLTGPIAQVPPAVSAKKVDGQRLYRLARKGVAVEVAPARVEIFRFDLVPEDPGSGLYRFEADVSPGTYIRALARDLGAALGCGGGLVLALRRTGIGPWTVEAATPWDPPAPPTAAALRGAIVPPEAIPLRPPPVRLPTADASARFCAGNPVRVDTPPEATVVRVIDADGRLLGIAAWEAPFLLPRVVLPRRPA